MKPILNIENLTKIYGNVPSQTKALNGITFQVMPGEFLGIMGSSGSGKSTLLNCIATVIQPTGGSIQVEGDTLQSLRGKALAEYRGKKVGYVFRYDAAQEKLYVTISADGVTCSTSEAPDAPADVPPVLTLPIPDEIDRNVTIGTAGSSLLAVQEAGLRG